ncbi:MAG: hypothetical protein QXJ70_06685 [Acidilobaceae archaeon]
MEFRVSWAVFFLIIRGNAYKLRRSLGSDEGIAPSRPELNLYESPVSLSSTAIHESTWMPKFTWARWKSLDVKVIGMNI